VRALRQLQRLREDADYETDLLFDEAAGAETRLRVESFRTAAQAWLLAQGYVL